MFHLALACRVLRSTPDHHALFVGRGFSPDIKETARSAFHSAEGAFSSARAARAFDGPTGVSIASPSVFCFSFFVFRFSFFGFRLSLFEFCGRLAAPS